METKWKGVPKSFFKLKSPFVRSFLLRTKKQVCHHKVWLWFLSECPTTCWPKTDSHRVGAHLVRHLLHWVQCTRPWSYVLAMTSWCRRCNCSWSNSHRVGKHHVHRLCWVQHFLLQNYKMMWHIDAKRASQNLAQPISRSTILNSSGNEGVVGEFHFTVNQVLGYSTGHSLHCFSSPQQSAQNTG